MNLVGGDTITNMNSESADVRDEPKDAQGDEGSDSESGDENAQETEDGGERADDTMDEPKMPLFVNAFGLGSADGADDAYHKQQLAKNNGGFDGEAPKKIDKRTKEWRKRKAEMALAKLNGGGSVDNTNKDISAEDRSRRPRKRSREVEMAMMGGTYIEPSASADPQPTSSALLPPGPRITYSLVATDEIVKKAADVLEKQARAVVMQEWRTECERLKFANDMEERRSKDALRLVEIAQSRLKHLEEDILCALHFVPDPGLVPSLASNYGASLLHLSEFLLSYETSLRRKVTQVTKHKLPPPPGENEPFLFRIPDVPIVPLNQEEADFADQLAKLAQDAPRVSRALKQSSSRPIDDEMNGHQNRSGEEAKGAGISKSSDNKVSLLEVEYNGARSSNEATGMSGDEIGPKSDATAPTSTISAASPSPRNDPNVSLSISKDGSVTEKEQSSDLREETVDLTQDNVSSSRSLLDTANKNETDTDSHRKIDLISSNNSNGGDRGVQSALKLLVNAAAADQQQRIEEDQQKSSSMSGQVSQSVSKSMSTMSKAEIRQQRESVFLEKSTFERPDPVRVLVTEFSAASLGWGTDEIVSNLEFDYGCDDILQYLDKRYAALNQDATVKDMLARCGATGELPSRIITRVYGFVPATTQSGRHPLCGLCGKAIRRDDYRSRAHKLGANHPCITHNYHSACFAFVQSACKGFCVAPLLHIGSHCTFSERTKSPGLDNTVSVAAFTSMQQQLMQQTDQLAGLEHRQPSSHQQYHSPFSQQQAGGQHHTKHDMVPLTSGKGIYASAMVNTPGGQAPQQQAPGVAGGSGLPSGGGIYAKAVVNQPNLLSVHPISQPAQTHPLAFPPLGHSINGQSLMLPSNGMSPTVSQQQSPPHYLPMEQFNWK